MRKFNRYQRARKDGIETYRATGIVVGPFRSYHKAQREGRQLAAEHCAIFIDGYGSLHGTPVDRVVIINNGGDHDSNNDKV